MKLNHLLTEKDSISLVNSKVIMHFQCTVNIRMEVGIIVNYYNLDPGPGTYVAPSEFGIYESKYASISHNVSQNDINRSKSSI